MPKETFSFNLNLTLGMLEVGVLLSMFGFGIVRVFEVSSTLYMLSEIVPIQLTSQTYTYYERFRKDSTVMKLLVGPLLRVALLHNCSQ